MSLTYDELHETLKTIAKKNYPYPISDELANFRAYADAELSVYLTETDETVKEGCLEEATNWIKQYYRLEAIEYKDISQDLPQWFNDIRDEDSVEPLTDEAHQMLDRVHEFSQLRRHDNPMHGIIEATIGAWLDTHGNVVKNLQEKTTVKHAKDGYLREIAEQYGIKNPRDKNGKYKYTDDELRNMITHRVFQKFTVPELRCYDYDSDGNDNELLFYTFVPNPFTQLTSHNTYLSHRYFCYGTEETMKYYANKYITEDYEEPEDVYYEHEGIISKLPHDKKGNLIYPEEGSGYKAIKGEIVWL